MSHKIEYADVSNSLKHKNHAVIPVSLSRNTFEEAARSFLSFLALPQDTKEQFRFLIQPSDGESFVGYMRRAQARGDLDQKEYFHYNRYAEEQFKNHEHTENPVVEEFLARAGVLYEEGEKTMVHLLRTFEEIFPGIYEQFFPASRHPHFYLRFLKYDQTTKGDFLAHGHYDQGACTLALAESAPGLRIGNNSTDLCEVNHKEGYAIFMPGLQFGKIFSEEFRPAWHDVIQRGEHAVSSGVARWAIVFFADPFEKSQTRWEDRHTPLY